MGELVHTAADATSKLVVMTTSGARATSVMALGDVQFHTKTTTMNRGQFKIKRREEREKKTALDVCRFSKLPTHTLSLAI